ncbi:hypothetical protein baBA2_000962 (plasmid) [Borrelia anserina]|uniref:Protein BptA n=2 Tax=Borrelia anserina TaxID=143 RepID=W5SQ14_BORAN|nr:hypothetical protein [Borrelia anserina]AHH08967.1 hypothetical protein BAN_0001800 [Borrelia anserina BA2]APR65368.1 hypothetical protein N187_A49 [Borrelia anserina Es]UPA07332.1 hypothetical protein baBA2_000962 [Borrelia anserina]
MVFTRLITIMCHMFLFYVLIIFLISANVESYCENNFFCYKRYSKEFKSGSISRISFWEQSMTKVAKEQIKSDPYKGDYTKAILEGYPAYFLKFTIAGECRAVNIKSIVFDGAEAEVSVFELYEPSAQLATIKDFQMGDPRFNEKFLKILFPVPVHNTFTIALRRRFVDKLKNLDRIKVTLTSHYDKEFVLETDNFIKNHGF